MRNMNWVIAGLLMSLAVLSGCQPAVECGAGTIERDGVCVAGDVPETPCGVGSVWDDVTQTCVAPVSATCGDNTVLILNDAGTGVCIGIGGVTCDQKPVGKCTPPQPDKVSVCGRVFDFATTEPLANDATAGAPPVTDRSIALYDPMGFLFDPSTEPINGFGDVEIDACGWYFALNVPVPTAAPLIAVAVDDRGLGREEGDYRLTGVASVVEPGSVIWLHAFSTSNATDAAWGTPSTPGFATYGAQGVWAPIYVAKDPTDTQDADPFHGQPVAGVVPTHSTVDVPVLPADDFYFSDTVPTSRVTLDGAATATGPNGTALVTNQTLEQHSGTGPANCTWNKHDAASVVGVIFAMIIEGECI